MKIPQKNKLNKDLFLSSAGLLLILVVTLVLYWPVAGFGWITGLDQDLLIQAVRSAFACFPLRQKHAGYVDPLL